jgi:hypothetical protein
MKKPRYIQLFGTHQLARLILSKPEKFISYGYNEEFHFTDLGLIPPSKAVNIAPVVGIYYLKYARIKTEQLGFETTGQWRNGIRLSTWSAKGFGIAEPHHLHGKAIRAKVAELYLKEENVFFYWDRELKACFLVRDAGGQHGEIILDEVVFQPPACFPGEWEAGENTQLTTLAEICTYCIGPSYHDKFFTLNEYLAGICRKAFILGYTKTQLDHSSAVDVFADYYSSVLDNCCVERTEDGELDLPEEELADSWENISVRAVFHRQRKPLKHLKTVKSILEKDKDKKLIWSSTTKGFFFSD